ncbi:ABC transporter permease [Cyanobium sp. NIES-981]|uniref:ABC transporter permease n=1 Tax=Cyanobium sp. NIES-981 TaxID=1851505 RepID=UPI0007DE20D4|nr:ABC transporter permease [Cyanobium sp. NIES-981]SBO44592.1 putative ABC transporter involved in polysaccharide efflux [Cyanobium sp. NIES-981]
MIIQKLFLQLRIVNAIARRELQMRAAMGPMGVVGVFVEPLFFIAIFMSFRLFGSQGGLQPDYINPVLWTAIGFVGFFMFSEVALKALNGVKKSTKLTYYNRIRPIDYLLGSAILDTQVFSLLILAFILGSFFYEWKPIVEEPGLAVFYFVMLSLLAFGVGLVTLIIGHRIPFVASIARTAIRRLLLFTSCIFFSISTIPNIFRGWILWNPLAHGIELLRHAFNHEYPIPDVSAPYLIGSTIFLLGFGFFIYGNNESLLLADED